ncbi:glycosyltransferase family 9 protein [Ferrimonas aestuarii]|uniref:Glycosyltransferase family 9 protein n=1 Tax=Ferrimonas aestuarii TaxID=2569539 RepID=A0A4U1BRJ7_9GAMM|nr:glycosyltransferase family 9 protein [Ferrimonas aestuarii]TKB58287.1 glycosyltransferase family 9 protein [Ferrimonas aestuarii]
MKVDTMRNIDHYAGVPLCFLLSMVQSVIRWFTPAKRTAPKNVLFVELSEMGSAILADPAMRWLKQQNTELHFVIFKDNAVSLSLLNTIPKDNIFTIRPDNLVTLALDTLKFLAWSRQKGIDTVIDLELFSRFTALLSGLCGASNRVGFHRTHDEGLYRGNMLTHPVMYNSHRHISQNFMALVRGALAKPGTHYQKALISDDEVVLARAEINPELTQSVFDKIQSRYPQFVPGQQRIMLVNPNASDLLPQRRWFKDRFAQVIRQVLSDYPDMLVIITGSKAEFDGAEVLSNQVDNPRCINSAGLFEFKELVPLYAASDLMLSNDSGPPHFASVTGLKTFVIFGPETPSLYSALGNCTPIYAGLACSPCVSAANHRKTSCVENECLNAITAEQVLAIMQPALSLSQFAKAS